MSFTGDERSMRCDPGPVSGSSGSALARGQDVRSNRRLPRVRRPRMVSHSCSSLNAIRRMSPQHPRALQWKLLFHPRHQFRPRNPRRVVRAGLLIRVTTASCPLAARVTESHSSANGGRAQYRSRCSKGLQETRSWTPLSAMRTLASMENPLFSQANIAATEEASSR